MQTFEVFTNDGTAWHWRLRDAKRRVIAQCPEPFSRPEDCLMMIDLLKMAVPSAAVDTVIEPARRQAGDQHITR